MMQMVQRWRVTVTVAGQASEFWINDNFLSNVLRKVADIQFSENGLSEPTRLLIALVGSDHPQIGITTTADMQAMLR